MGGKPKFSPQLLKAIDVGNERFRDILLIILGAIVLAVFCYNIAVRSARYLRTLICLNNTSQRHYRTPQALYATIKQHAIYAPLFSRQHSKQAHIKDIQLGILPTRLQSMLLLGIIIANVTFAAYGMEWHGAAANNPQPQLTLLGHLRNRTGLLAVTNMIPLFIMAGRNNPLIGWLSISFDNFNLLHRWFGRIVIALAITHAVVEILSMNMMAKTAHMTNMKMFTMSLSGEAFIMWGFISFVCMLLILLSSPSAFRHAFYETFLHIHVALVALIVAGLWLHLAAIPSALNMIRAITAIWVIERLIRLVTLLYRSIRISHGSTRAHVEVLPGDALRLTLHLARPWLFRPGQHVYLTLPSVGLWTSHPFSIAWSDHHTQQPPSDPEKGPLYDSDILADRTAQTSVSLIIRRRAGFTDRLFKRTLLHNGRLSLPALIEGPYGGATPASALHSYGTVLLFAGGVGITHHVAHIRDLLAAHAAGGTTATRKILLVWAVQSPDHLEWIRPWMTAILAMPQRRQVLRIQLYITRPPRTTRGISSPSATVQMFPGKPDVDRLVEVEAQDQVGAMGVAVCGPGGLADDVRAAVRRRQGARNIDFWEEGFGW